MTKKMKHRNKIYLAVIVLIMFAAAGLYVLLPQHDILAMNLNDSDHVVLHIHPTLQIQIMGETQIIPAGIGIFNDSMRVIHTHDASGRLHVESPVPHQFYLRDFFTIWEKKFDRNCIFDFCIDENHKLQVFVNDKPTDLYENLPLNDLDIIKIVYN